MPDTPPVRLLTTNSTDFAKPRGAWASDVTYAVNDLVYVDDKFYLSKLDNNVGYAPATNPTRWLEIGATHSHSGSSHTDGQRFKAGLWYAGGSISAANASASHTLNSLRLIPFPIGKAGQAFDRVGLYINSAAGASGMKFRATLYADDGNGWPGALAQTVDIPVDTATGASSEVAVAWTIADAGLYWWGGYLTTTGTTTPLPNVPTCNTSPSTPHLGAPVVSGQWGGVGYSYALAADGVPSPYTAPATFPSTSNAQVAVAGSVIRVCLRAA